MDYVGTHAQMESHHLSCVLAPWACEQGAKVDVRSTSEVISNFRSTLGEEQNGAEESSISVEEVDDEELKSARQPRPVAFLVMSRYRSFVNEFNFFLARTIARSTPTSHGNIPGYFFP
jgi:hypothetical protein